MRNQADSQLELMQVIVSSQKTVSLAKIASTTYGPSVLQFFAAKQTGLEGKSHLVLSSQDKNDKIHSGLTEIDCLVV